jgi:predicted amidohydrolase/ribosomal protein S18 acetylase RimI-like enzyme
MDKKVKKSAAQLHVRRAQTSDVADILALTRRVYPNEKPYLKNMILGQINNYPEGQFVVESKGKIIGYAASLRISEKKALAPHTWAEITGGGYGTTHEKNGTYLYGYEVVVDRSMRGQRIGQRIYNARKSLVEYYRLKGIIFAGRIPNFHKKAKKVKDVYEYIDKVTNNKFRDPVLGFQIKNGFEIIRVLPKYHPADKESLGYGVLLKWDNPNFTADELKTGSPPVKNVVRVATVQYQLRKIQSFESFEETVRYFVDVTSDYKADFVVFPELFTMQLLSIKNDEIPPHEAIIEMTKYTDRIIEMFQKMAVRYNINIIGGSTPTKVGDHVRNTSYVFLRNGEVHSQEKIHPTPDEKYWWNIEGGEDVKVINTDCGPIGVLICYDSEFPELTRHLTNQGMQILFVPFLTDERQGYSRVRYCCQARAIENQLYVVMSGNVGNLPRVHNVDIQYAQSCILTPCDFPFARDGVASDTTPNVETVAVADLRIDSLIEARNEGTVQNLKDRRHDLYSVQWKSKDID